jgi:hypothetical protein
MATMSPDRCTMCPDGAFRQPLAGCSTPNISIVSNEIEPRPFARLVGARAEVGAHRPKKYYMISP